MDDVINSWVLHIKSIELISSLDFPLTSYSYYCNKETQEFH
jgi:hypothetical protein